MGKKSITGIKFGINICISLQRFWSGLELSIVHNIVRKLYIGFLYRERFEGCLAPQKKAQLLPPSPGTAPHNGPRLLRPDCMDQQGSTGDQNWKRSNLDSKHPFADRLLLLHFY